MKDLAFLIYTLQLLFFILVINKTDYWSTFDKKIALKFFFVNFQNLLTFKSSVSL